MWKILEKLTNFVKVSSKRSKIIDIKLKVIFVINNVSNCMDIVDNNQINSEKLRTGLNEWYIILFHIISMNADIICQFAWLSIMVKNQKLPQDFAVLLGIININKHTN